MRLAVLLFVLAILPRLLFWQATADRELAWSLAFAGDAPVWQAQCAELARAATEGVEPRSTELVLPLRPPAMTWLVSALWDGSPSGAWKVRLFFALLGALVSPLLYLLARSWLGERGALCAAMLCAFATNLILLSSGAHSEILYLVLLLLALFDQERLRTSPSAIAALRWGALHALLCLVRVEHLLTFAALAVLLALLRAPRWQKSFALAASAIAAILLPYQLHAMAQVAAHDAHGGVALPPDAGKPPRFLAWDLAAMERLRAMPSYQRLPALGFVNDTLRARGATRVRAEDLEVLREAYGSMPEPLPMPLLALYGGLNFFLANSREADGGFSNAALYRPPPLSGGDARYPPGLSAVLPQEGELNLGYPPHLHALRHGYALGFSELVSDPAAACARIAKKLAHAAEGLASGFGAAHLPLLLSGTRRPVDFVTSESALAWTWRALWLALGAIGLGLVRRDPRAWPWLAILATKLLVAVAFFGYARQGAVVLPIFALGIAACLDRALLARIAPRRLRTAAVFLVLALVAYDVQRAWRGVDLTIDGERVTAESAASDRGHRARVLRFDP